MGDVVTLINYGVGNIKAFENSYKRLNVPVHVASTPSELKGATKLILPGVGAFDWAMSKLHKSEMLKELDQLVLGYDIPVLGICVGMQMMARSSEEGQLPGLGWFDASVRKFEIKDSMKFPLPHMGWNDVQPQGASDLFSRLKNPEFYFLHSFYFSPNDKTQVLAYASYGNDFACAVGRGNIFGVQFHPEKSHDAGMQLLLNFARL